MAAQISRWIAQDENGDHLDPPLDFPTKREALIYEMSRNLRLWLLQQIPGGAIELDQATVQRVCDACAENNADARAILRGDEPV